VIGSPENDFSGPAVALGEYGNGGMSDFWCLGMDAPDSQNFREWMKKMDLIADRQYFSATISHAGPNSSLCLCIFNFFSQNSPRIEQRTPTWK